MLKIAVFAPIPSASVTIATRVNPGDLRSWRKASFKSFMSLRSESDDRVDACGAASWHAAGDQRDEYQRNDGCDHSPGIDCAYVVKQRHQRAAGSNRTDQSNSNPDCNQCHALAEHEFENVCALRAESHANPEFASALGYRERHHAVQTHARKH